MTLKLIEKDDTNTEKLRTEKILMLFLVDSQEIGWVVGETGGFTPDNEYCNFTNAFRVLEIPGETQTGTMSIALKFIPFLFTAAEDISNIEIKKDKITLWCPLNKNSMFVKRYEEYRTAMQAAKAGILLPSSSDTLRIMKEKEEKEWLR